MIRLPEAEETVGSQSWPLRVAAIMVLDMLNRVYKKHVRSQYIVTIHEDLDRPHKVRFEDTKTSSLQRGIQFRTRADRMASQACRMCSGMGNFYCERSELIYIILKRYNSYNGPVEESAITARKRSFSAGNRTWLWTLPAPEDWKNIQTVWPQEKMCYFVMTYLTPYCNLVHHIWSVS